MDRNEERAFNDLLGYIEQVLEFEASCYNENYLDRRISARMRRTDTDSYRSYRRSLECDGGEREELLDALSITVTGFFRDPDAWEALRLVLRELTAEHRQVRVWSAPCADGREPYSLAMLSLDDDGIDAQRIEIIATDINSDILETARAGAYEVSGTTDIAAELESLDEYNRYIERAGDRFTECKENAPGLDPGVESDNS